MSITTDSTVTGAVPATGPSLQQLCSAWQLLKAREQAIVAERHALEAEIVALAGRRDDGQLTVALPGMKLTVKANVSQTLDLAVWDRDVAARIPSHLHPIRVVRELDPAGVRFLREQRPDLYTVLAQALTRRENKPSVSITPQ